MTIARARDAFRNWPIATSGSGPEGGPITEQHTLYDSVGNELSHLPEADLLREMWRRVKILSRSPAISWDDDGEPIHDRYGRELIETADKFRELLDQRIQCEQAAKTGDDVAWSRYLSPPEWQAILEKANKSHSSSSWLKFKDYAGGEEHAVWGNKQVRLKIDTLESEGLTDAYKAHISATSR